MTLVEGSIILIQLHCGCGERRVTVIQGHQKIRCRDCERQTDVELTKLRDGAFKLRTW